MEDLNNNENEIMEDLSKSDDEGSIIEEGLIAEILPNKNILIIHKRTIYLYYCLFFPLDYLLLFHFYYQYYL